MSLTSIPWEIVLGALAAISAIIAIIQAHKSHKLQKEIVAKQGIFLEPEIILNFNKFNPKTHYYILYGKLTKNRALLFPYQIEIRNVGNKSVNKVELNCRLHKRLHGGLPPQAFKPEGFGAVKSEIFEYSNFHLIKYDLGTLNPKKGYLIYDSLHIASESLLKLDFPIETADHFPLELRYKLAYFNLIDYVIYSENQEPVSGQVKLLVLNTAERPFEESLKEYIKLKPLNLNSTKNQLSMLLKRLKTLFKAEPKRIAFICFDESKLIKHKDIPVDEVPIGSIKVTEGLEFPDGSIWYRGGYYPKEKNK
ncbi:MAG: hypothetical protein ACFFB3_05550 [Candidatus Hodarchaeota archaeon]